MKKPNIFLASAVIISSIFLMSNSNDSNDTRSKIKFNFEVKFNCTLYFKNQFKSYNIHQSKEATNAEFITSGVCTSKNFDKFDLMMSHVIYKTQSEKSARIGEGTFDITGDDGHQIYGTYEGIADLTRDPQDLLLFFSIKGGTGYYANAKGYLRAMCRPDAIDQNVRILKLKGTILRDA